jgi:protein-L-isoaspartate(D-aspartate) O-methyltransferase
MLADQANQEMIDRLIAEGSLWSPDVIAAFRATPRHLFLDRFFQFHRKRDRWEEIITRAPSPEELRVLYADRAIITRVSPPEPGKPGQAISSSSQPSLMAQMLEDLQLSRGLRVMEIGTGTGYNAALLSHVVGPGLVTSLDVDREVLSEAWDHLRKFPDRQVDLKHADGRAGYAEAAPFHRVIVTAATPDLEPAWLEQTSENGIVLAPVTFGPNMAYILRGDIRGGAFHGQPTRAAFFMPLRAEGEAGDQFQTAALASGELQKVAAPWKGWFDGRRPRTCWLAFAHSLSFFALLKGMEILPWQSSKPSETNFGIASGDACCHFAPGEWMVTGERGRKLGVVLWREFLDQGAPRPAEYYVHAAPGLDPNPPQHGVLVRRGPRCVQHWFVRQERDRPGWP